MLLVLVQAIKFFNSKFVNVDLDRGSQRRQVGVTYF